MATKSQLSPELKASRRQLVLHDGAAFLILTAITAVLFVATLLLFRSFSGHRVELAHRWAARGRLALQQKRPSDAIVAFRTSLSYSPGDRDNELLLAQSLADGDRLEEANDYFLNLWDAQPGDGFINLQLARLARRRTQTPAVVQSAIDYYHASIYGNWNGDGTSHRRDVRLELANYLIDVKQPSAARAELLIAAGNAPSSPDLQIALGDTLLRAGDTASALREYQQAFAEDPHNALAYDKAGHLAYQQGDYAHAREWLEHALRESAGVPGDAASSEDDTATLLKNSERILLLDPASAPAQAAHITRLLDNRSLALKRLSACTQQLTAQSSLPNSLQALDAQWAANKSVSRSSLLKDPTIEAPVQALINTTETLTSELCGPPTGDDAFLLLLAKQPATH
jgi:tetratricopeptide (TPR) repeat protein